MTTKQIIAEGEAVLKTLKDTLDSIELLEKNKDDKKMIEFLLDIQKQEFKSRLESTETKLAEYKKQRVQEFEVESAETNMKITGMIEAAEKWIGKEPIGVTCQIAPLIDSYQNDNLTQEMRNDIYFGLKGHVNFLTNKLK